MALVRSLVSAADLLRVRHALRDLEVERHMRAASDPTMLFAGVIFGHSGLVATGFHEPLWAFKRALFYHGDRIVEAHVRTFGLDRLQEDLSARMEPETFYTFPPGEIDRLGLACDHARMVALFDEVRSRVLALTALDAGARTRVLRCLVAATHRALESTFLQREWETVDLADPGGWQRALSIVEREEHAKNVRVVTQVLEAKLALGRFPVYAHPDERIVAATSRWFTLLDDPLDLAEDLAGRLPNYVFVFAQRTGEWESLRRGIEAKAGRIDPEALLLDHCPLAHGLYREAQFTARREFVEVFPVLPHLLAWWVERRATRRGESPF